VPDQPGDVDSTLNDLERKLRELENDLRSVVEPEAGPEIGPPYPVHPPHHDYAEPPRFDDGWTTYAPLATPAPQYDDLPPLPPLVTASQPVGAVADSAYAGGSYSPDAQELVAEAQRRISGLRDELDDLSRAREQIVAAANQLVSDYDRALHDAIASPPPPPPPPVPAAAFYDAPAPTLTPPLGAPLDQTLLQGNVSIDAGLFRDLTTLSAFENALQRVTGVLRVATRGFADGRALIDIQLAHPVTLAHELRALAPMPFSVTEASPTHLMIAIGGQ
jgi:hypothetical protein